MHDSLLQWFAKRFLDRPLQPRELLSVRKVVYLVLIVGLFFTSFLWRRYSIEPQAEELAILEKSHGEVELSGTLVRLILTGSRGVTTTTLWMYAIEAKKKNRWNELQFYVSALTKLQPHFITPWLFQSWNLAYNVSVESDRPFDKYYYIAEGTKLLAEGERKNRNIPDMRYYIGFYLHHKIGISDETNVMRSLLQLSMLPPNERDPARFRSAEGVRGINWQEFESFCKAHPKLVRRLTVGIRRDDEREQKRQFTCQTAEQVVDFLEENWRLPGVYREVAQTVAGAAWAKKDDTLADSEKRFPPVPPQRTPEPPQQLFAPADGFQELTETTTLTDAVDCQMLARAWYGYAQEPIPPPGKYAGSTQTPTDPRRQRKPKQIATLLFRQYPALAQSQHCRDLQQEGWFDDEPWSIPYLFEPLENRFSNGTTAAIQLADADASQAQWRAAASMWRKHAEANHLIFRPAVEEVNQTRLANDYWAAHKLPPLSDPLRLDESSLTAEQRERLRPEQKRDLLIGLAKSKMTDQQQQEFEAALVIYELSIYRNVSNFQHHYYTAGVEAERETVVGRKRFAQALEHKFLADPERALAVYLRPDALPAWRDKVLAWPLYETHREYREDADIQEETFNTYLEYLLLKEPREPDVQRQLALHVGVCGFVALNGHAGAFSPIPLNLGLTAAHLRNLPRVEVFPRYMDVPVLASDRLLYSVPTFVGLFGAGYNHVGGAVPLGTLGGIPQVMVLNRPLVAPEISQRVLEQRKLVAPRPVPPPGGGQPQQGNTTTVPAPNPNPNPNP